MTRTFPLIKDHVLLKKAGKLGEAAELINQLLTKEKLDDIISNIPEDWLNIESEKMSPNEMRAAYVEFLTTRLSKMDELVKEASDAR